MDSGNSGSMQSSSGGDEEYDSRRADSIPTNFFSNPSSNYHHHHHHPISTPPSSLFNNNPPSSNYLDAFSSQSQANPNSLLNLDVVWSRGLQLDHPNYTTLVGNLTAAGSSTTTTTTTTATSSSQSILIGSQGQGGRGQGAYPSSSSAMLRPVHENGSGIVKNPKKRTRASRRAPTTVLTTDTSNFRAMVQEFTGIPAPPFSAASSYSRRLDLFGTGAAAMRSGAGHSEPSLGSSFLYPLRPSAQKIHQFTPSLVSSSPLFLNSSIVDTSTTTSNNANLNSNPGKYQADDQDILMNMQNDQMLTFQSLMQQQPPSNFPTQLKYSLADEAAVFGMKTQGQSQLEELRMSHGNVNANNANINVHTSWGSNNNHSHEKGLEMINNVSSRGGEGTVDSWICPSD